MMHPATVTNTNATRATYPSDLCDEQWQQIEPWLPDEKPKGRHRETNLREVANAINYRDQIGCPWRMLPHDFPAWGTVYSYYRRWIRDGTLSKLRKILQKRPITPVVSAANITPATADQSA